MLGCGCSFSPCVRGRIRFSPLGPLPRLGVRHRLGCGVFSLASGLPSTTSAGDGSLLFGCFVGTMPLFDSPRSRYRVRALVPSDPPDAVGSPQRGISELHTQPTDTPVQRFKCGLTTALAWLGAGVARYTFPVRLLHSLLHAGLSPRYPGETACPTRHSLT